MTIITDSKKLAAAIQGRVRSRAKALILDQTLLISCTHNAMISGRADLANRLIEASGFDGRAMVKWCVHFKYFSWITKTKDKPAHLVVNKDARAQLVTDDKLNDEKAFVAALLKHKAYYELTKAEAELQAFDLNKMLAIVISKAEKAMSPDADKTFDMSKTFVDPSALTKLKAIKAEMEANRVVN